MQQAQRNGDQRESQDQVASRQLDVAARELKKTNRSFYTISSAGHEDNAVVGARLGYRLPYRFARMSISEEGGEFRYRSEREGGAARFRATYAPVDHAIEPEPGTLEHFLTERYALFTVLRDGGVLEAEIHHRPWPLQPARADIDGSPLAAAEGVIFLPEPIDGDREILT